MKISVKRPPWFAIAVLASIVLADQLSKTVVLAFDDRLPLTVVGGFRLELVRNSGVSFSLFTGSGLVIAGVAAVVVALLALFLLLPRQYSLPLAVLLGGSLGNLIDRLRFDGNVIDFIAIYWWPRWNIADAAIVAGAALMVLTVIRQPGRPVRGASAEGRETSGGSEREQPSAAHEDDWSGSSGQAPPGTKVPDDR